MGYRVLAKVLAIVPASLALFLVHCGAATSEQLLTRAAFDLDCPETKLKLTELDSDTMGVSGCGQRATYVESCDSAPNVPTRSCTWILNSDTKPTKKKRRPPKTLDDTTEDE